MMDDEHIAKLAAWCRSTHVAVTSLRNMSDTFREMLTTQIDGLDMLRCQLAQMVEILEDESL